MEIQDDKACHMMGKRIGARQSWQDQEQKCEIEICHVGISIM